MPGEASLQHKLDRVRSPRVQITYDVETNGSRVKKELPFVLGVMADLAGHPDPDREVTPLSERVFTEINRDTFDNVMVTRDASGKIIGGVRPRLELRVRNELQKDGSKLGLEIEFQTIDDFDPENVVKNIHTLGDPGDRPLQNLLEVRRKLSDLKRKAVNNSKFESLLQQIIRETDELKAKRGSSPVAAAGGEA